MPITQEELVVNSRDEARALGVELVTRLFVARAPNGTLMFFMLPKEAAEGKAEGVARRLGSGVHPLESLEPEKWGGLALQGVEGVRQLPSVGATLAALRELRRKLGAHSAALTLCTTAPLYFCTAAALHLCTSAPAPINIPLISFASSCAAPPPPHPATAGEKGAAAAGATLCPKADLSRLKVDRAKLLEKIKAGKALSDAASWSASTSAWSHAVRRPAPPPLHIEVSLGLGLARVVSSCAPLPPHPATAGEKGAAAAGATLCPEADLSRLRVDRAAMLEKIKARKALSDDEWECVRLGITERSMRRTSNRTLCLCMSRALQPPSTLEKGRELGRCVQL